MRRLKRVIISTKQELPITAGALASLRSSRPHVASVPKQVEAGRTVHVVAHAPGTTIITMTPLGEFKRTNQPTRLRVNVFVE